MITDLTDKAHLSDSRVTNISKSFTHKMASKTIIIIIIMFA